MKPPKKFNEYISLMRFLLHQILGFSRSFIPISIFITILNTLRPFIFAFLPYFLIDELIDGKRIQFIIIYIVGIIGGGSVISFLVAWLSKKRTIEATKISRMMDLKVSMCMIEVDYPYLEDHEYLDLYQIYKDASNRSSTLPYVFSSIFDIIASGLTLFGYIVIMVNLVLTDNVIKSSGISVIDFIASNTWIWILLMVGISILASILQSHANNSFQHLQEDFAPTERAYRYYQKLSNDYSTGKDIRLFGFYNIISDRIDTYLHKSGVLFKKLSKYELSFSAPASMLLKLQVIIIYGIVTIKVMLKAITFGQFYLYSSVINNVISTLSNILADINSVIYAMGFYYSYKSILTISDDHQYSISKLPSTFLSMEIRNVSFCYPGNENWVLKDFSCVLSQGERISIVGLNGAGKTTLIKLLQRLYKPTKGVILLNGINIQEYDFKEYMKLFSTVFQDVHHWAYSAGENVACSSNYDSELSKKVINDVGLWSIFHLRDDLDTYLTRHFSPKGIVLSGGENQKLAISRALYKNAPIFIFDEPTAALDPLAEKEIMDKFNELTLGKTTIFISHRLSSCRFSDKILVIDQGKLYEQGTHEELIARKGIYADLWSAQAQYYQ